MPEMKIKIIATGSTPEERAVRRWGVSFLVGENILFDTFGDPQIFWDNLQKFNVNITAIEHVILSHDHWDHTGGLWKLLEHKRNLKVHVCKGAASELKKKIREHGAELIETSEFILMIDENCWLPGEMKGSLKGQTVYEQALVIRTENGLGIICGCAHPGIVNIVKHVKDRFPETVNMVLGGFHMKDDSQEDIEKIVREIGSLVPGRVAPTHCTGEAALKEFRKFYGKYCIEVLEGTEIVI